MAKFAPAPATIIFLILLTSIAPPPASSLSYFQYKTLVSLSHSLLTRVANLRAARGDISGSTRARILAEKIERGMGLGFWKLALTFGWDYLRNYAWRDFDYREICGAASDLNELMTFLGELTRADSDEGRASWVARNYGNVLSVSKRMFRRLKVFATSGAFRELVETVQRELAEGELLKDCLELGGNDLKATLQIFKELALQFHSSPHHTQQEL